MFTVIDRDIVSEHLLVACVFSYSSKPGVDNVYSRYYVDLPKTGRRIKEIMAVRKMSNNDVADALNLTSSTAVKSWRSGRYAPSLANAVALAQLFGVRVEDIIVLATYE